MIRGMEKVGSIMQMEDFMKDNGLKDLWKDSGDYIILQVNQHMKENGNKIDSLAKEQCTMILLRSLLKERNLISQISTKQVSTGLVMKEGFKMIKSKEKDLWSYPTETK